ncbi:MULTISPECIES: DUF4082 domain-containing protein [unclassified Rhizobium]|uniref:DUF4082 domain-containing protein n=1 Tax=unclassified Rhizobium TaxID=2613769 RepID=UPI002987FF5D|nr:MULTISPECIES: DUF4082 domain-containing protein [unclassified Rhizobium]
MFRFQIKNHDLLSMSGGSARTYVGTTNGTLPAGANTDHSAGTPAAHGAQTAGDAGFGPALGRALQPIASALSFASSLDFSSGTPAAPLPGGPAIASPVSLWSYVFSAPLGDWSSLKPSGDAGGRPGATDAGGKPALSPFGAASKPADAAGPANTPAATGATTPQASATPAMKVPTGQTPGNPEGTDSSTTSTESLSPTTQGSTLEGSDKETIAPEMTAGTAGAEMPGQQTASLSATGAQAPASAPDATTAEDGGAATLAAAAAVPNKIALENMKEGNPYSEWSIEGDGDATIQGFATEISTNIGGTVDFKIATDSTNYRIDIYRLGYYGGDGARLVDSIQKSLTTAQVQPHPIVDMSIGLIDAGNWDVSASWEIPDDAVSGVYIAKLVRLDGSEGASHIPFVVRDDASTSDIVFQTSDTTWQAYNAWGGASLYFGEVPVDPADMIGYLPPNCSCGVTAIGRASAVSYNRPIVTNTSPIGGTHDFVFGVEHSAIQWLEQNGYDVSYISGVDSSRNGQMILNHDAFLSVGHDEYWSAEQRAAVEQARDSGVNLAFWGGNDMYWKIRWEDSIDGNGTPYRTMVCYKETWGTSTDPSDTGTGTWRDPRYADPGQKPENALIGTMFTVDSYRSDEITVGYDFSNLRFWRDTDIADLQPGQTYTMPKNILGYEWNSDVENGFRPAGLVNLSLSTVSVESYLRDYGTTVGDAVVEHSLTMYRAESGALVFSAGTVFWSWGLNDQHSGPYMETDRNVQQSMVNMFADMGIQPTTLVSSLILASESTDTLRPTSTITTPVVGATFIEGQHVTVTGTAADLGGGVIAGVEISTDGGQSWFKATGRENWSFNWVVQASGTYTIMSRAVDDSLNLETPGAGKQVTVNLPSNTVSLWTQASKPAMETTIDRDGVEVGLRFETTTNGTIEGIRFYKGFYNTGSHRVSLWDEAGNRIATGISTNESITGWQTVKFSSPVQITAGTTYTASYHTKGYYSSTLDYFDTGYQNGFLKTNANASVYSYTDTPGTFPGSIADGRNYWVDVLFNPGANTAPVAVDDNGFTIGRNGMLTLSIAALVANDTDANGDQLTITAVGGAVNGTVTLNTQNGTVIFQPNEGYSGPASFTYTVSDGRNGTDQGSVSLTVEEGPSGVSLFNPGDTPVGPVYVEGTGVELGMKFVASSAGEITGIRFYKAPGDTGTHTGALYDANGTRIASVTFTNESLSGWQTATFSNPIQITAGQTYTASYHSSNGTYYATGGYFSSSRTNGPLTAPSSDSVDGGNGVFRYGTGGLVPTQSYNASNYWVDVVFKQSTVNAAPVAANDNGYVATYNTALSIGASLLLANDNDPDGDALVITGAGNATNGTVAYNSQTNSVVFTPTTGHTGAASFSYTVSDGRGGTDTATVSLTVAPQSNATSLFSPSDTPSVTSSSDTTPVELGMKFVSSSSGQITGLRYYKSAQDNGTHVGSLWTASGDLITSATFVNESASGWQTVLFSQPVTISAGTTYVASYQSNGRYAVTPNYFTTTRTNGDLSAPSSATIGGNGVFAYGSGNEFPNQSWNSSNYWVDVLYERNTVNTAPVAVNDPGYQTQTGTPITIQASALLGNDTDADGDPLTITGVSNAVNGQVSFDSQANTVTFTPTAGHQGSASFRYEISDGQGGVSSAQVSLNVNAPNTDQTIFANSTPTIVSVNDNSPVNLGMKFQADVDGWITGIRFYKAANNTGPHTGYLWSADGDLITSATFTNETASGWQLADLAQDVEIDANTTYIVSYSTNGNYSATAGGFNSEVSNGNLRALSSTLSGGNGVYAYGSSGVMPASSYNSTNYYVDVAFRPQLAA